MTTAWRMLPAALLVATALTAVPAAAATAETRVQLVSVVRDTVGITCAGKADRVVCEAVHQPRTYLAVLVTTLPAPPGPQPRARLPRTPAASPALP